MKRRLAFGLVVISFLVISREALALTISPPLYELSAKPGQTLRVGMKIFNEDKTFQTWYFSTQNFEPKGEEGEPVFVGEFNKEGLAEWIKTPEKISIAPGELKKVEFEIKVPNSASPGGYYSAIFLNSSPPGSKGIGVATRIGALVLLRIEGEVIESAKLLAFKLQDKKIKDSLPVSFLVRIKNEGTVHIKPAGYITIKNLLGKEVAKVPVNLAKGPDGVLRPVGNILPNSVRRFTSSWGKEIEAKTFVQKVLAQKQQFALGRYQANLVLTYGKEKPKKLSSSLSFWIIPWQILIVSLVLIFLIIALLVFGIRKYNSWIISRALNQKKNEQ